MILFHVKTPRDVTDFLRDFHNRWTDALGKSFLSILMEARNHNLAWLAHAKLNRITAGNCGKGEQSFAARCWHFVSLSRSAVGGPFTSLISQRTCLFAKALFEGTHVFCYFCADGVKSGIIMSPLFPLLI